MTIEKIIDYALAHPVEFIAIITLLITILSQILVIIEYFRLKGRWDYYFLDDTGRYTRNRGFNPEYLTTSLFISAVLLFMLLSNQVKIIICNIGYSMIAIIAITSVIFIASYIIFYIFSREDINKGIYTKEAFFRFVLEKSLFTTVKYFLFLSLFCLVYHFVTAGRLLGSLILIVLGGAFEILYEYNIAKIRTSRNRKFDIIVYEGREYCILENINAQQYYAVNMQADEEALRLYLDQRMLICSEGANVFTKSYKKVIRLYMGNVIEEKKFAFL